jgi:hypothetical protein
MSVRGETIAGSGRMRYVLAAIGLVVALFMLAPGDALGAKTWKECVDDAFADYNDCLMESTSWFNRTLCDLSWELEVAVCTAAKLGDIKNAYNEGSEETP